MYMDTFFSILSSFVCQLVSFVYSRYISPCDFLGIKCKDLLIGNLDLDPDFVNLTCA